MTCTLILATQRSGSTLLCADLSDIGGFGRPGEHFLPWLGENPDAPVIAPEAVAAALAEGRDANGTVGLKLMADYLPRLSAVLCERPPGGDPVDLARAGIERIEGLCGPACLFRIDRADAFDQALSRYLATATGVYFRTGEGAVIRGAAEQGASHEALLAELNVAWLDVLLADIARETAFLDALCARLGRPVHRVAYEALCAEPGRVLAACCAHAGREPPQALPPRWMRKVVADDLRDRFRARAEEIWERRAAAGKPVPAIARAALRVDC